MEATTISVKYRFIDGYHIFTSDDVYGMYVAHQDAQIAYEHVQPSIKELVKQNEDIDVSVAPVLSFEDFVNLLRETATAVDDDVLPSHPAIIESREFLLIAA